MTSNSTKKLLLSLLIAAFWIGVWYLASFLVGTSLLLPTPHEVLIALFELLSTLGFYEVVLMTLLRVILGLVLGIVFGITLAILSHRFPNIP